MNDVAPTTRANPNTVPRAMPVMTVKLEFNTDHAQRVYRRAFDRLKGDLYVCTVRTRSSGMDAAADAIENIISEAFSSVRKDLDSELERVEVLLDAQKIVAVAEFPGVQSFDAQYSTPRAKEYLDLLRKMDQLLMRYDTLWLAGEITTHQRVSRSQNWQRRLIKVANRLRELGNRTRHGLTREAQLRAAAPNASESVPGSQQEEAALDREDSEPASEEATGEEIVPAVPGDEATTFAAPDETSTASSAAPDVESIAAESEEAPTTRPRRRRTALAASA